MWTNDTDRGQSTQHSYPAGKKHTATIRPSEVRCGTTQTARRYLFLRTSKRSDTEITWQLTNYFAR